MSEPQKSQNRFRLVVDSLGEAKPASAAAVAKGLGIPAAEVVRCLYRAPATLVEDIEFSLAEKLRSLMVGIGFEISIEPLEKTPPKPAQCYELAVYLKDISRFSHAVSLLSSFLGAPEKDAQRMLMTAPGTVLGGVSSATIESFIKHMQGSVEVTVCEQNQGLFSIFTGDIPVVVRSRLMQDICAQDIEPIAEQGLIATDVPHDTAAKLWERHKNNTALRIINQKFLRYDIFLEPLPEGSRLSDMQRQFILDHTDIPDDMIDEVIDAAPLAVIESVEHGKMKESMEGFIQAGLVVRADLITFQYLQLYVLKVDDPVKLNEQLMGWGGSPILGSLPQATPEAFPEIQARMLQHVLQQQGAEVELVCA